MPSSSLLGNSSDRWPLARAVDALGESARRAGRPGLVWIAGALYPGLYLNVVLVNALFGLAENYIGVELPVTGDPGQLLTLFAPKYVAALLPEGSFWIRFWILLALLPVLVIISRTIVGLAKTCDPRLWESEKDEPPYIVESGLVAPEQAAGGMTLGLRPAWQAGRGLGFVALGLWTMLVGLLLGAGLVLIGPVVVLLRALGLEEASPLLAGLLVPPLVLLFAYAVVLMVINQLALHSLAHNQRGVSSALTHAWRLMRAAPMSALRATVVDFVLSLAVVGLEMAVVTTLYVLPGLTPVALFLLYGFAGVTRAGFWARTYRALGGLSSADRVPGL